MTGNTVKVFRLIKPAATIRHRFCFLLIFLAALFFSGCAQQPTAQVMPTAENESTRLGANASIPENFTSFQSDPNATLSVTYPVPYTLFQRDNETSGQVRICGSYTGRPTLLEVKVDGNWTTLYDNNIPNPFCAQANASVGQFNLTLRLDRNDSISQSIPYVSVGELFVIAGQSNAVGQARNKSFTDPANPFRTAMFANNRGWFVLYNHTSVWPLVANQLTRNLSVPIAFVYAPLFSTPISSWRANGTSFNAQVGSSFDNMVSTVRNATNGTNRVRAILFFQGESGEYQYYYENLSLMVSECSAALNITSAKKVLVGQTSTCANTVSRQNVDAVRKAQRDAWLNLPLVGIGPTSYAISRVVDYCHFVTDSENAALAGEWVKSILYSIYGLGDAKGAVPVVAAITGDGRNLTITFDKDIQIMDYRHNASSRAYGFRINRANSVLTDRNVESTTVAGNNVTVRFDRSLSSDYTLSYASFNDTDGLPVLMTLNEVPVMTIYEYPLSAFPRKLEIPSINTSIPLQTED